MTIKQIYPVELQQRLSNGEIFLLLDVREPHEFAFTHIKDSISIPMNDIPYRLNELDPEQEIVLICHHGIRSQQVAEYLHDQGFKHLLNLSGGVAGWASECDLTMPRY